MRFMANRRPPGDGSLSSQLFQSRAKMFEQVARKKRFFACVPVEDRQFGGPATNPGAHSRGITGLEPRAEETGRDAGENVAHAAGRHSGVAGGVVTDWLTRFGDDSATAFQKQRDRISFAKADRPVGPAPFLVRGKPLHL